MKYAYMSKTYKQKNKLKILLTILLAVLIFTTGYILSKNVFSKLDYEYFNETTKDGINIKVVGERGIIPNNSILKIEKVSKEEKENVDDSINDVKNNNMNTVESYTYDIKILDSNNNEIEPSEEIKILFTNDLINNKNLDTNIYHTSTDKNNNLTTEVLKGEVEEKTITTKTDSFSYYTVEFTYNNLTYSIEGDSEVKLSTILEQVGLEGEVTEVSGSNDNLFSFEKKNNEWYVKAHQAFTSQEWMKVIIDGIEYEITVTDATNYTITYNSGSDGHFEGGATTNVVSYSLTTDQVTKYSHTPNVDDTGLQNGNYANSLNTNEVVTIPGATTLTVDIYYNGESVSYDWLSVWAGNYPSYTASSNRTSEGYVTTDMGAPDNNNKFGGSQSGSYTVNGNSLTNMGHCTLTIQGDSVTFGFKSDNGSYGKGYGYYAIISGTGEIRSITSGTYKEPIPNNQESVFKSWSQNPDTTTTNTTVTAVYVDEIASGVYDGVNWRITGTNILVIGLPGQTQTFKYRYTRKESYWPWFQYKNQITSIRFAGPVNGNGSHYGMFYYFTNATNITDINRFNTSNIIDMKYMFYNCSSLISLDVSNFDTSKVTNMYEIFGNCSSLTSLDVSSFNTSNVTDMEGIFYHCSSLTSLDVSNFNTSNATTMRYLFLQCSSLTTLDVSNFNTSNVTNMEGTFRECNNLTNLDLSNFDTRKVTNMAQMFFRSPNLKTVNLTSFNTSNVTTMSEMFEGCGNLINLNFSNFDTSRVTNMQNMFSDCKALTTLNLNNFNTSNVTNMKNMFEGCTNLRTLDISNFDTSNVVEMTYMFDGCEKLTTLNVSSFETNNVKSMRCMFLGCTNLTVLDLSGFDTSRVTDTSSMFSNCTNLTTIYVSDGWNIGGVTSTMTGYMFYNCYNLVGEKGTVFGTPSSYGYSSYKDLAIIDDAPNNPGFLTYKTHNFDAMAYAVFDSADGSLTFFKDDVGKYYNRQGIGTKIYYSNVDKKDYVASIGDIDWYDKRNEISFVKFDDIISPTNTAYWFYGFINSSLTFDFTNLDTSNVTNMSYMFNGCSGLTSLDLSTFNTNNVTNMAYMFSSCSGLTSLDLSTFNTNNVTNMAYMFNGCRGLTSLDLSTFNTSNVTNMTYMFNGCSGLTSFDVSNFDTSSVRGMIGMFAGCSGLTSLDLSTLNTENVTAIHSMFLGCRGLTSLDLSTFNTHKVKEMQYMFADCNNLRNLNLSVFDTSEVTYMRNMFAGCSNLKNLNLSNFDTTRVTDMNNMFNGCSNLTNLNLSSFNTASVPDMNNMFNGCNNLKKLDLSSFDTSYVVNMTEIFAGCSNLKVVYVSDDWNVDQVTESSQMFSECTSIIGEKGTTYDENYIDKTRAKIDGGVSDPGYLTDINSIDEAYAEFDSTTGILRIFRDEPGTYTDKQEIDTKIYYTGLETITGETEPSWQALYGYQGFGIRGYITSVVIEDIFMPQTAYNMFSNCVNLTTISGMENFDTSRVTNMSGMFEFCENLTNLDLSYFDTSNVIDMSRMFTSCEGLTTLDLSSFNTSKVTDMNYMFTDCYNLEIFDTSSFDTSKVTDMSYMFSSFGHFIHELDLRHFDTSSVTTMAGMFRWSSDLIYIYLDTWDTSSVEDMNCMFDYCRNLDYLNIESFDTSSVTNMSYLFQGCSNLQIADVSNFNTSNVTNMSYMFSGCKKLREIDTSNFDTVSVTNMDAMFNDCSRITGLNLTSFDTSNVTGMYNMINSCTGIYHLDLSSFDTSQVTDMSGMLRGLTNIYSITFGTDWEFKSNNVLNYAWKRDVDTVLYTAEELAAAYDGSTMAGVYKRYMLLNIVETVQGDLADINKEFNFTVTVLYDNAYINGSYRYIGTRTGNITFTDGRAIFTLKHNETIGIYLLYNSKYSINQENDGYTLSKTNYSGWLKNNTTSTFTDVLTGTTPTGIYLDLVPFIILITFGILGIFLIRKFKYI